MESGSLLNWETSRSIGELLEQHQLPHILELPCRNPVEINPTRNRHTAIIHSVPANLIATRILRLRSDQRPNHLTQHIVNLECHVGRLGQIVLNGRIRVKWIGEVLVQSELSGRALEFQHTRDHRRVLKLTRVKDQTVGNFKPGVIFKLVATRGRQTGQCRHRRKPPCHYTYHWQRKSDRRQPYDGTASLHLLT